MLRLVCRNLNNVVCKRYKTNVLKEMKEDDKKNPYVMGAILTGFTIAVSGSLFLKRQSENKKMNSLVNTIPFDEFLHKYLLESKVSSIIYQPPFSVADVYLEEIIENENLSEKDKLRSRLMQRFTSKKNESIARPPDIRVQFGDDSKVLRDIVKDINKHLREKKGNSYKEIKLDINDFPSNNEFFFITISASILAGIMLTV
uniref:Altered inheritance of mitochondria protein 36, mitochondrial n=1 Tax=Strongyloides papillosus TaxID=174720 RepID=A0A0N5B2N4_STREA